MEQALTKVCRVCGKTKPISSYHPNKTCSLGVVGTCKPCSNERVNQWYKDNRSRRQKVTNTKNRAKKDQAVALFGGACHDCNVVYPSYVFQFHHLDPSQKDVNPSHAMAHGEEKMWRELSKCVMLCANCHIIRHRGKSDTTDGKE